MKQIGYKVVSLYEHRLFSFNSPASLEYEKGKRIYPKLGNGSLCVFTDLDVAISFRGHNNFDYGIFKCEYRERTVSNSLEMINAVFYSGPYNGTLRFITVENSKKRWKFYFKYSTFPSNTKLAKWVKLLEKIA